MGLPKPTNIETLTISRIQHLLSKITVLQNGCWSFNGAKNQDGYNRFNVNKREVFAHRAFYELFNGEIEKNMLLDHTCHNKERDTCVGGRSCEHRACVNPAHLKVVTIKENLHTGNSHRFNLIKTHCPQGHEYSVDNTQIKRRKNGSVGRSCMQCKRDYMREYSKIKRRIAKCA